MNFCPAFTLMIMMLMQVNDMLRLQLISFWVVNLLRLQMINF